MKDQWKTAFFSLLGIVVIVPIVVVSLIFVGENKPKDLTLVEPKEGKAIFTIDSSKEQLNYMINKQLVQLKTEKNSKFDYEVRLQENVEVNGFFTFFSNQINFSMDFEPQVLHNGNLLLKEEAIRIGALDLPGGKILEFMKGSTDLPPWIVINEEKETILVKLTEIKLQEQLFVKAESFDLQNDKIRFRVFYTTE